MASQAELQLILSALDRATAQIKKVGGSLGTFETATRKSTVATDAFNRTSTRMLAAFGAISPTAATATSQMTALTGSTNLATIAIGALVAGLIAGVVVGKNFVTQFSNLNEAINASTQVFGESQGVIDEFAKTSARTFGISKRAANEYAASLGSILEASGFTRAESALMSVNLVRLAGDLASFKNLSIDVALQKIRSGLVGEAEPLRTVGVLLSEAAVKAKAYELGIADVGSELTEAQKVQARYAIIFQQTQQAQGDAVRTGDQLANRQRQLNAVWEDSRATLGQKLLPAAIKITEVLILMASAAAKLAPVFDAISSHINLIGAAILVASALLGGAGIIPALVFLAFRWEKVFKELPGPVQSAAIAVAGIFDSIVNGIVSGLNTALSAIEDFVNKIGGSKIIGAVNFGLGKLGAPTIPTSINLGQIEQESNIASTLKALANPAAVFDQPKQPETFPALPPVPELPDTGAGKAAKEVDILSDGIISLTEALANGISIEQAAILELGKEAEDFANRLFRVAVETRKLALLNEPGAIRSRALLELAEAEVEAGKKTLELQTELAKLYITLSDGNSAIRGGAQLLLSSQVAFVQSQVELRSQMIALQVLLGEQGLTGKAFTFRNAMSTLGEGFRQAGESVTRFLDRLSNAALKASQTAFDQLFNRPTRETAGLQLQLAELNRTRLLRLQSGATEDELKTLDDQISTIQRSIDIKDQENKILQLNATLADKTLLTNEQQVAQAFLLIGVISQQSALVDDLNDRLAFEVLAQIGATDALNAFADALREAQTVIGQNHPSGFVGGGSVGGGQTNIYVTVPPGTPEDQAREFGRSLQRQVARASLAGVVLNTGSFSPQ